LPGKRELVAREFGSAKPYFLVCPPFRDDPTSRDPQNAGFLLASRKSLRLRECVVADAVWLELVS